MEELNNQKANICTMLSLSVFLIYNLIPAIPAILPQIIRYVVIVLIILFEILGSLGNKKQFSSVLLLHLGVVIFMILLYVSKWKYFGTSFFSFFAVYYFFWMPLFYCITLIDRRYNSKKIWYLIITCLTITIITTIIGCLEYRDVARLLAGKVTGNDAMFYTKQNIGGYGLVYGAVLTIPCLLWRNKNAFSLNRRFINAIIIGLILLLIVLTQYSIAIVIAAIIFSLYFVFKSNNRIKIVIILVISLIAFLIFRVFIAKSLISLGESLSSGSLNYSSDRFISLGKLLTGDNSSNDVVSRSVLYGMSWKSFCNNPLFGCLFSPVELGGHSEVLDILGALGITGFILYCLIFNVYIRKIRIKFRENNTIVPAIIILSFIILSVFNTASSSIIGISVFLLPFVMIDMETSYER